MFNEQRYNIYILLKYFHRPKITILTVSKVVMIALYLLNPVTMQTQDGVRSPKIRLCSCLSSEGRPSA